MKSKLKSIFMLTAMSIFTFMACQETEVFDDGDSAGTVASPTKPVDTVGIGTAGRTLITTNTTWNANTTYFINGEVVVSGATLTIEAGTLIRGVSDPNPNDQVILNSVLVIDTDAQIFAEGMPNNPIVFTSDQPAGQRNPGDWGGVVVLGPDVVNQGTALIEGLESPLTFGGSGDTRPQGSGVIQYTRIEFSGTILQDGDETNGLTLGGVGTNTTLSHIQVSRGNDDGFEFFGGSVSAKFLISWQTRDDDFDTDFGHTGCIQYAVSRRSNAFVSTESNGIETDNDGSGSTAQPLTKTLFANITFIGPGELEGDGTEIDLTPPGVFNAGALIRRRSSTNLVNSIITGWPTGTNMRDVPTAQNYVTAPHHLKLEGISVGLPRNGGTAIRTDNMPPVVSNQVIARYLGIGHNTVDTASAGAGTTVASIVGLKPAAFATGTSSASGTNPAGTPDFTLIPMDPNLSNAKPLHPDAIAKGLVEESFRGAFDEDFAVTNGNWNFSSGWLEFDPENAVYH